MALKQSTSTRNAQADTIAASLNAGKIRIYGGARAANPQTAPAGTLLAELTFGAVAFGAAANGVATANAITGDSSADATGTAAWARLLKSDGTTAVLDVDVTATGGGGEITFGSTSFIVGGPVSISSLSLTENE